jgi:hypothetical protein
VIRTRKIKVRDRIFRIPDLMRIASILDRQIDGGKSIRTSYKVEFDDGVIIEGAASEVFADGELNRPSRPKEVQMWLFKSLNESINVDLEEGNSETYSNKITISAADAESADALYARLNEAVEKTQQQTFWGRKHEFLLYLLLAMGLGFLGDLALKAVGFLSPIHRRILPA